MKLCPFFLISMCFIIVGSLNTSVALSDPAASNAITAIVKPYAVSPSLKEVVNLQAFKASATISTGEKQLLSTNLFAVAPEGSEQLTDVYEQNDYNNIPSFITTDSVLQAYHVFYDFTLRTTEEQKLMPLLQTLTAGMIARSLKTYNSAYDPSVRVAALYDIAYFAVAANELGLNIHVPAAAEALAAPSVALIANHAGPGATPLLPTQIDYSQFVPRGHYTRSETLKHYFKAMMWYGKFGFQIVDPSTGAMPPDPVVNDRLTRQVLLITHDLYSSHLIDAWEKIYEPTAFYVGTADDVRPDQIRHISALVYGEAPTIESFGSTPKLGRFQHEFAGLPGPAIQNQMDGVANGRQFRFMGQRYIPDSEIMQGLVSWPAREFPSGLDVMAVLGGQHAADILDNHSDVYNPNNWPGYLPSRKALTEEFAAKPASLWKSNLYWSWLDALRVLNTPVTTGYPSFMLRPEWQSKTVDTSLASWTELRHDTVLYAKQGISAECGSNYVEPPKIKEYVEPNPAFYERLLALTMQSQEGLSQRGLLTDDVNEKFGEIEDLLTELDTDSRMELKNEDLGDEEYGALRNFGGNLEQMTLSVMGVTGNGGWSLVDDTDRDIAVIADVHSNSENALEEGVGHANEILVIVPIAGKLYLTRGATFSYYEFEHPSSDRMTDEEWQAQLNANQNPPPPVWTKTYSTNKGVIVNPKANRGDGGGC